MGTIQIVWTALPNGLRRDGSTAILALSVLVSPRLRFSGTPSGALNAFPDFLDWPAQVSDGRLSLDLIVDGDAQHPVPTRIVSNPQPASDIWKAIFNERTFVRTHALAVTREAVSSYDAREMVKMLYRGYGDVAQTSPYALADRDQLKRAFPHVHNALLAGDDPALGLTDIGSLSDVQLEAVHAALGDNLLRHDAQRSFEDKLAAAIEVAGRLARRGDSRDVVPLVARTSNPASAVAQFAAFHRRVSSASDVARPPGAANPDAERMDFHQILAAASDYRDLARRLGVVIDVEVEAQHIAESLFGSIKGLQVRPRFRDPAVGGVAVMPITRYVRDLRPTGSPLPFPMFAAAPRGSDGPAQAAASVHDMEIVAGLLNLNLTQAGVPPAPQFDLVQVDVDGAMSKVLNALDAIVTEEERPAHPIDPAGDAGAPAFRTSGLSLVRAGHGAELVRAIARADRHEDAVRAGAPAELFHEDLVRGYRIDVRRFAADAPLATADPAVSTPWLSLHERIGTFTIQNPSHGPILLEHIADEGFVQPAVVQGPTPAAGGASDPFYTPESLFHWTGWNLSAPRPGTPVELTPAVTSAPGGGAAGLPQVGVEFDVPSGRLPRLRFGHYYQVRARTVDLAGNGLSLNDADAVIRALEAQGSPTPVLFRTPTRFRYRRFEPLPAPALALRRGVTEGESIDTLVIRSNGSTTAAYAAWLDDPRFAAVNERHVVPPKAALSTVESHGLLDGAVGVGGNPGAFYALCKRENGMLAEQHGEEQIRLPFLPDPFARGAAIFGLPGVRNTTGQLDAQGVLRWSTASHQVLAIAATTRLGFVTEIDFGPRAGWPDLQPFRLKLDELPLDALPVKPEWSPQSRVLTVRLAPGETRTIFISSYPERGDVDVFGLHAWCREQTAPSTDEKHFLNMAAHGALALISPPRKVRLVHAVQQPVTAPIPTTDKRFSTIRFEGDTSAYFAGAFVVHVNSTAKLDLFAEWKEADAAGGVSRTLNTHVFEIPIPPVPSTDAVAIATLDEQQRLEFQPPPEGAVPPTRRYLARQEFGDTKHRKIHYKLAATTRFREYFPARVTAHAANLIKTRDLGKVTVLSSARPAAPEIVDIVPAFGWIVDGDVPEITQSARRGGGLRVYLGPTWFSSGDGEQLAVLEAPGASRWGLDPLHASPSTPVAAGVKPDVPAVSAPGSPYDGFVHAYDVQFDCKGGRGFYCDLTFSVGDAYAPFKELALARYQRHSLPGLHLSPIVRAGIYQLASDRTVTLSYPGAAPGHPEQRRVGITVSATAIATRSSTATLALAQGLPLLEVTVEERPLSRQHWDDSLGWTLASPVHQPVADQPPTRTQLFFGHALLPRSPGAMQRRLVVREYEVFAANPASPPGQAWIGHSATAARRLVYADTIRLD